MGAIFATISNSVRSIPVLIATLLLLSGCETALFPEKSLSSVNASSADTTPAIDAPEQTTLQRVQGGRARNGQLKVSSEPLNSKWLIDEWRSTGGDALLVWKEGKLVIEEYSARTSVETRFRSFSLHKSVVGLVASMMHAEGIVDLDRAISDYLPKETSYPTSFTLRDALQHHTGLERFAMFPANDRSQRLLMGPGVNEEALSRKQSLDPTVFDYDNANYQLAGIALETALGATPYKSYKNYLSEKLWAPIGNSDAFLWTDGDNGSPRFYAGLQASARDWLRIGMVLANNGRHKRKDVISASAIETYLRSAPGNDGYGLGVWKGSPENGMRSYGPSTPLNVQHSAPFTYSDVLFFDGFGGQRVYISPSEQLVVVRLGEVRFDWDDAALFNLAAAATSTAPSAGIFEKNITVSESVAGANDRTARVRYYIPGAPCDCPLVVFSHGAFSSPDRYDRLLKPLAETGVSVVAPMHVDSEEHPDQKKYAPPSWSHHRLEDISGIHNALKGNHSTDEWIAMGHSFGGLIAQLTAGATASGNSVEQCCAIEPSRIIALSPPGIVEGQIEATDFTGINRPMVLVTGTKDVLPLFAKKWEDHLDSFHNSQSPATAIVFKDADHYFNGLYGRQTDDYPADTAAALVTIVSRFINGEPLQLDQHEEIEAVFSR